MRGLRNIVVHKYFGIDMVIVWETIRKDLPPLGAAIKDVLKQES